MGWNDVTGNTTGSILPQAQQQSSLNVLSDDDLEFLTSCSMAMPTIARLNSPEAAGNVSHRDLEWLLSFAIGQDA